MKKSIIILTIALLTLIILIVNISFAKYQKSLQSDFITITSKPHSSLVATVEATTTENQYNVTVTNNNDYDIKYKIQEENDLYNLASDDMDNGYFSITANTTKKVTITLSGKQDVVYEDMGIDSDGSYFKNINLIIDEAEFYDVDKLEIATGIKVLLQKSAKNQIIKASGEITGYKAGDVFHGVSDSTESGLCSIIDPASGELIYFYRGNVQNNYFSFAGQTWRILRINSDGSLRLILDGTVSESQYQSLDGPTEYTIEKAIELVDWEKSTVYTNLHTWYDNNIAPNYSDYVVQTDFVFDTSNQEGISSSTGKSCYYFGPYLRVGVDGNAYQPTFSHTAESLVQDTIGLITADEVLYAGGFWHSSNASYFLYNSSITTHCWTMSPSFWDNGAHYMVGMIVVESSGRMHDWPSGNSSLSTSLGLRPVLSVKGDLELTGTGIQTDPYKFKN